MNVYYKLLRETLAALLTVSYFIAPQGASAATHPGSNVRKTASLASATIVNLGALLGPSVRFVPTAINELGQIVGYDDRTLATGFPGAAYLIDADGTFGALDRTGITPAFYIPLAVSASGDSIAGETNGLTDEGIPQTGPVAWRVLPGAHSHEIYRHFETDSDPYLPAVTGIANGNVPVGGYASYGATGYSITPFKSTGCALPYFVAEAANGGATIAGSAGNYAATDTLSGCATFVPGVPRPANASTSAVAENASGSIVGLLQGPVAPAFGAFYLVVHGAYARIPLPPTYSSATYFVQTAKLSDANTVVGNVSQQVPPFAPVAPYLFANGRSIDVNTLLPAASGWRLVTAAGVNRAGTIVGTGVFNGVVQGYELHP